MEIDEGVNGKIHAKVRQRLNSKAKTSKSILAWKFKLEKTKMSSKIKLELLQVFVGFFFRA